MTAIVTIESGDEILIVNTHGSTKEKNEDGTLKSSSSLAQTRRLEPGEKATFSVHKGAQSLSIRVANKYDLTPRIEDGSTEDVLF